MQMMHKLQVFWYMFKPMRFFFVNLQSFEMIISNSRFIHIIGFFSYYTYKLPSLSSLIWHKVFGSSLYLHVILYSLIKFYVSIEFPLFLSGFFPSQ